MSQATTWKRREKGSYVATVDGQRVAIVNMKGDGPNAPAWQGPVASWQVRVGGNGDYDHGSEVRATEYSFGDAKSWVEKNLNNVKVDA